MCGIAGVIFQNSQPDPNQLSQAASLLRHRGPDDVGVHIDGAVGLVHTRLSIIDLTGGHQPLTCDHPELCLVTNGEIYNFVELRSDLERRGRVFSTLSDSETILQCYAQYGLEGFKLLHGMFAFALHEKRGNRLLLGRDRLGIKPLFYSRLPDRLIFASEIKAILHLLPRTPNINPGALVQFLQNQFTTGRGTIFEGIYRVLPGEIITIEPNLEMIHQRYWSPLDIPSREIGYEQAHDEFNNLFSRVIDEHMRSDVPFGLFLSGGVDSAVLLAMLTRLHGRSVKTYSVGFSDSEMKDELDSASMIASRFNADHHPISLNRGQIFRRLVHTVWASDDLMRDYASLPTSILAENAGRDLKVVFSGEGGDEVFAGYRRYRLNLERRVKTLLYPQSGGFRAHGHWRGNRAKRTFGHQLAARSCSRREPFISAWNETHSRWGLLRRSQYTDLVTALPDNLLVKADRMLMAFGVEGRVPFLDHRIVEFGLSLPDHLKIHKNQGKWFLRNWAEKYLPRSYLYQNKRGFHVPIGEWLQGRFLDQLGELLSKHRGIKEWFHISGVKELIVRQRRKGDAARELWCLMQFAIWHTLFIERPGSVPSVDENPLDWISSG